MAEYMLNNIDDKLWRDFRAACTFYQIDMRREFIRHIRNLVGDYHKHRKDDARAKATLITGRQKL
ncbi:hypothetical protein ES702_06400 [subsurface metagenome]